MRAADAGVRPVPARKSRERLRAAVTADDSGWWHTFFDECYLRTYGPRQSSEAASREALAALALAGTPRGGTVLDLPCGYGRHTSALAAAGYRVVGADYSWAQLAEARRRWPRPQPEQLVRGDYRHIPLKTGVFDTALCLYSSLGYVDDTTDQQVLREYRRVLKSDGRLVIETMHRDRTLLTSQPRTFYELPDGAFLLEEAQFDPISATLHIRQTFIASVEPSRERQYAVRLYTVTELVSMLQTAGFSHIACFGDLEGAPFTPRTLLTIVARAS
ncbi:class I SAM-dependent methyltransferase [Lentzea sp. BCCO 10_0061]|uniref:Class I SAM-dependent methyltransferase n=1 Tax=Lentzea sokolovensis TaxID=3095429 RepID=A0ABU4VDT7_9PSEU|nr:class I SAM-dependent methyltransferase [Lentzea sp. BCCO 10_0061]MDX8149934.1 class I SAM-dependent methyltransferase [Lentzea sp. BCCO 10_0061]